MTQRICFVSTAPLMVKAFLLPHILAMKAHCEITVLCNSEAAGEMIEIQGVTQRNIPLQRTIRPLSDLYCLWLLWRDFRSGRYDAVVSTAPKGGLLGMAAAWMAGVPVRSHWFTGQVWATRHGLFRQLLMLADRLIATLTNAPLVDSASQLSFLRKYGVLAPTQGTVLASGSICGVDCERFIADVDHRRSTRQQLRIPESATLLIFVGRLSRDKGVRDLVSAFRRVAATRSDLHLLLVGPDEDRILSEITSSQEPANDRIHAVGYRNDPEVFMAAADIFCLCSYREGFGNAVIEAAACELPTIASRIYGLTDAVVEVETGWLHNPADIDEISSLIRFCVDHPAERRDAGIRARRRVLREFDQAIVTQAFETFISQAIATAGTDSKGPLEPQSSLRAA